MTRLRRFSELVTAGLVSAVVASLVGCGDEAAEEATPAIVTAAGMLSSTLLTLLVVPTLYVVLDSLGERVRRAMRGGRAGPLPASAEEVSG